MQNAPCLIITGLFSQDAGRRNLFNGQSLVFVFNLSINRSQPTD